MVLPTWYEFITSVLTLAIFFFLILFPVKLVINYAVAKERAIKRSWKINFFIPFFVLSVLAILFSSFLNLWNDLPIILLFTFVLSLVYFLIFQLLDRVKRLFGTIRSLFMIILILVFLYLIYPKPIDYIKYSDIDIDTKKFTCSCYGISLNTKFSNIDKVCIGLQGSCSVTYPNSSLQLQ